MVKKYVGTVKLMRYVQAISYLIIYRVSGKKFTQEILNKIRSFVYTHLIFAHLKVGRSVW